MGKLLMGAGVLLVIAGLFVEFGGKFLLLGHPHHRCAHSFFCVLIGLETAAWHLPSAVFGYLDFHREQRDWQSSCKEAAAYFHIEEKTLRILAKEHPEVAVFMNRRYIILREEMGERGACRRQTVLILRAIAALCTCRFSCQWHSYKRIIELERSVAHGRNVEERGQQNLGKSDHRG